MSIRERITLQDSSYLASWRKIDRKVEQSADKHERNMRQMGTATQRAGNKVGWFGSMAKKAGQTIKFALGTVAVSGLLALGVAIRNISRDQIKFNQKMNESLAIMGDVSLNTRRVMEQTARDVASDLNIGIDKAAESYFFLASAGLNAQESIKALPAVAEFAKAGMFDMATATDLATDAQSALGLTVDDNVQNLKNMERVTDVLVKANQLANATVQQFSEALTNKAATGLRNVNKEIEEGVAVLAAYADQGIKGRRAGEYLSRTLRILSRAASENIDQFRELGLVTEEGNLESFPKIIEGLTKELEGLSDTAMTAKLEQMGFTAEVQEAIKPLIGMSDQLREYEEQLYDAGGVTQEVADKQMKSMQERVGKLWTRLKNTFGPPLLDMLQDSVTWLENFGDTISDLSKDISDSNLDNMIDMLKDVGGQKKLLTKLMTQQSINEAKELKKEIEEEMSGITVSFDFEERSFWDKYQGVIDAFGPQTQPVIDSFSSFLQAINPLEDIRQAMEAMEDTEFTGKQFDPNRIRDYKQQLDVARSHINDISNQVERMQDQGKEVPDSLTNQLELYQNQISEIERGISLLEQKKGVEEAITQMKEDQKKIDEMGAGEDEDEGSTVVNTEEQEKANEAMRTSIDLVKNLGKQYFGFQSKAEGGTKAWAEETDLIKQRMEGLRDILKDVNAKSRQLKNEISAGMDTSQTEADLERLRDRAMEALQGTFKTFKKLGILTPKLEKAFREMFDEIEGGSKDSKKETDEVKTNLTDVADALDAIGSTAGRLGGISEEFGNMIDSSADLIRNLDKMKSLIDEGAGGLSVAVPALGAVAGGIGLLTSIFGNDQRDQKLIQELNSLTRELRRNTEALREQALVGSDVSLSQREQAESLIQQLRALEEKMRGEDMWERPDTLMKMRDILDKLSGLGIEALEGFDATLWESIVADMGGDWQKWDDALRAMLDGTEEFEGMNEILEMLQEKMGQFGESLEGAIERFQMMQKLGVPESEAFETFIGEVIGLIGGGEDNELVAILQEILKANSPEERKKLAKELFEAFQANPELLGSDLTGSDLQEVINTILGIEGKGEAGGEGYSRSVQVARSITEIQANEVVAVLMSLLFEAEAQTDLLRSLAGSGYSGDGSPIGDMPKPDPLPVGAGGNNGSLTLKIPISIDRMGVVTPEDIDYVSQEIREKLKNELQYKAFG